MTCKDAFGNELSVGDRVIFNLSGELALGVVEGINKSTSYASRVSPNSYGYVVSITRERTAKGTRRRFSTPQAKIRSTDGIVRIESVI